MVAPVPGIDTTARHEARPRDLPEIDALFAPDLTADQVATRAAELLAGVLGDVAFLTLRGGEGRDGTRAFAFADPDLRARWQAAPEATAALLAAARRIDAPFLVGDTLAEEQGERAWARTLGVRAWLSVPLRGRGGTLGTLGLAHGDTPFTPHDLAQVERGARQIAIALDQANFAALARRHERAMALLAAVADLFTQRRGDLDALAHALSATVELVGQALGGPCALFLVERGQETLFLTDLYHPDAGEQDRLRATWHARPPRAGQGTIGLVAAGGPAQLVRDLQVGLVEAPLGGDAGGGKPWLCVPLRDAGRTLAVLTAWHLPPAAPFDGTDLALVEVIAGRVAAALAQAGLVEAATTFREMIEDSPDPAFTLSLNGRIITTNQAMREITGYNAAQLRERHVSDLVAPEEREATLELLAGVIISGESVRAREWTFVRSTGERRVVEIRSRVLTELGQPVEVLCAGRDLTARREQQRALERQVTELTTLHVAGLALADTLEPTEIQQALLGAIRAAIPCDDVTIYSLDGEEMQASLSLQLGDAPPPLFPHGHPLIEWSVQHGQSVLLNDAPSDPEFVPLIGQPEPLHLLIVPLLTGGRASGGVVLRRMIGDLFTLNDLRLVESIAAQAAVTLHNARLHAETSGAATDLRAVLESIQQGVIMTDRAGRIRFANRRLGELLGLDVPELIGRHALEVAEQLIVPQTRDPKVLLARLTWLEEHPEEFSTDEVALTRTTGRILERYTGPMRDPDSGATVGRIVVFTDVTEERQLERAKDEFLATASHELKTPITTLGGYLELLERQVARPAGPDPERLTRYVATARNELQRLHRLSEDLLMVARIEAGRLTLRPESGDLAGTIRETVERFVRRPGLQERGHRILCQTTEPLPAEHDTLRIGQVLNNLLENALKYSPAGGEVIVATSRAGNEALISVRDSGIGVPPDERDRLFLPFYRTTNASAGSPEGLGLGLYISRGIVEGHGGRIWVESAPDQGSIFKVALPLLNGKGDRRGRSAERGARNAEEGPGGR